MLSLRGPPTETLKDCKRSKKGRVWEKTKELPHREIAGGLCLLTRQNEGLPFYTNILLSTSTRKVSVWLCVCMCVCGMVGGEQSYKDITRQETTTDECVWRDIKRIESPRWLMGKRIFFSSKKKGERLTRPKNIDRFKVQCNSTDCDGYQDGTEKLKSSHRREWRKEILFFVFNFF